MNARRVSRLTFAFGVAAAALSAVAACVLAEPPGALPEPSSDRPLIQRLNVDPPVTTVLETWPPSGFFVPVEVPNPNLPVQWRLFIDYDPAGLNNAVASNQVGPAGDSGVLKISTQPARPALDECHTVEIIVAYGFDTLHAPDTRGGDSVTWIYAPTGSLDTCPIYDAGPIDAGADGAQAEGGALSPDGAGE